MAKKKIIINSFVAIDVETANHDYSSICQVGLVEYLDGIAVDSWKTLVDPQRKFSKRNTDIHGISANHVKGAIKIPELLIELERRIAGRIVVHYGNFDPAAICRASEWAGCERIGCTYLDAMTIARRVWPELNSNGYKLNIVSEFLNIDLDHHDALSDARAAGEILIKAVDASKISLSDWIRRVGKNNYAPPPKRESIETYTIDATIELEPTESTVMSRLANKKGGLLEWLWAWLSTDD